MEHDISERDCEEEICYRCLHFFSVYWRIIVLLLTPLIYLPIVLIYGTEAKFLCMYVIAIMATSWAIEAVPIGVTGFIPIFAFPVFGILSTRDTCMAYLNDTTMMCIGGIMFAVAIEYSNLHNRLALGVMRCVGSSMRRLHVALTVITTLISMWITNTAATAMMCPILFAILAELEAVGLAKVYRNKNAVVPDPHENEEEDPIPTNSTTCYYLTAAYASTIGGIGTLVGTGTNLTLKGVYEYIFPKTEISFLKWMGFNVPLMIIITILNTIWLQFLLLGLFRPGSNDARSVNMSREEKDIIRKVLRMKYDELGPLSFHERIISLLFVIFVVLLITRNPGFLPGYVFLFNRDLPKEKQERYFTDAAPVMFIVFLMFLIPRKRHCLRFFRCSNVVLPNEVTSGIMSWKFMNTRFPWSFIFLIGSGFAISTAGRESGMTEHLGHHLSVLGKYADFLVMFLICLLIKILTELMSNVAVANIALPVLAQLSIDIDSHPLYLMLPATLMVSMAFCLPTGTPPNAVVKEYIYIQLPKMILAGLGTSFITFFTILAMVQLYAPVMFPEINGPMPETTPVPPEPAKRMLEGVQMALLTGSLVLDEFESTINSTVAKVVRAAVINSSYSLNQMAPNTNLGFHL